MVIEVHNLDLKKMENPRNESLPRPIREIGVGESAAEAADTGRKYLAVQR